MKTCHDTPMKIICDIPVVWWEESDEKNEPTQTSTHLCGAPLYVVWSFTCGLDPKHTAVIPSEIPDYADASSWQIECENGHVHAMSSNQYTTIDKAEPCYPRMVLNVEPTG